MYTCSQQLLLWLMQQGQSTRLLNLFQFGQSGCKTFPVKCRPTVNVRRLIQVDTHTLLTGCRPSTVNARKCALKHLDQGCLLFLKIESAVKRSVNHTYCGEAA